MHTERASLEWLKPAVSLAVALAALLAGRARADETSLVDLRVTFANGAGQHSESGTSMPTSSSLNFDAELSTLMRWHDLGAGALLHADASLGGTDGVSVGGQLGLAHRAEESGVRFELLGVGGVHLMNALGSHDRGLLGGGTLGYGATLPFLGVRAGVYKEFGIEFDNHFTLGVVGLFDYDVGTAHGQTVTSYSCFDSCGGTGPVTTDVNASSSRLGLMFTLGWVHDFAGGR